MDYTYEPLYTVKEAAKVLKTTPGMVYQLMNNGNIPYLILGTKKIRGTDLKKFIESFPTENQKQQAV